MELLQQNWAWISDNPWGFAALVILLFGAGWGAARTFYTERIELLKEKLSAMDGNPVKNGADTTFRYKSNGRHGPNVLSTTVHDAVVGQHLSFQAQIPDNQKLHVVLHGPPPSSLSDTAAAWYFNVAGIDNWVASRYRESASSPTQHFNAESGPAEMQFSFGRAGDVRIEVFEGDSPTATWSKRIHVSGQSAK
jgi:hypothetical protein